MKTCTCTPVRGFGYKRDVACPIHGDPLAARPRPALQRIAPGVYADDRGGMHLVLPELLTANGYADTPENRATLIDAARRMFDGAVEVDE